MLDVDLGAFITTVIIFLGLIAFLNAKLYKPLLSFMEEREACIKRDEDTADKNFLQIDKNNEEIEEILNKARDEGNKIKEAALKEIKAQTEKEINEKKDLLQKDFDDYLKNLEAQKEELKNNLSQNIPMFKSALKNTLTKI